MLWGFVNLEISKNNQHESQNQEMQEMIEFKLMLENT